MGKIMNTERELTIEELDMVTGGLVVPALIQPLIALTVGLPQNSAAMGAWNNLLTQYGY
jgi:hypothetical protein